MKAVIQRVSSASVTVEGEVVGAIGLGLLVLLGIGPNDTNTERDVLIEKIVNLRIFNDQDGKFNLSLLDVAGSVLVVSQFTLFADLRRGRRPGFSDAAPPAIAAPMVDSFVEQLRQRGLNVATGRFGAHMQVALVNDGPVTIQIDTEIFHEPRRLH